MPEEIAPELLPGTTRDCLDPWVYIEFNVNGDVRPCCVRPGIGNLEHNTLFEILNGEPVRALRASLLTGNLDSRCANCRIRPVVPIANFQTTVREALDEVQVPADFDAEQYLEANPDVRSAGLDAALHFKISGRYEARRWRRDGMAGSRNLRFDPDQYLKANPDIALSGADPWQHFFEIGQFEGRRLRIRDDSEVPPEAPAA